MSASRPRRRIVCLGEAMVELSQSHGRWDVHYGGDTLNAAIHLTRLGHDVAYLTALGSDPFAGAMRAGWEAEGMDLSLVLTVPDRTTGLYSIATDEAGERHFAYWRAESAARCLFEAPGIEPALDAARSADLLFFSLISLAILPDESREKVLTLARGVRAGGGQVAFDSNYRPRLWESLETARRWHDRAIALADFGLPSLDDEQRLGVTGDAETVRSRWLAGGCSEVAVKLGAHGVLLSDGTLASPPSLHRALDTSGAGDAFDAGYLSARIRGAGLEAAARGGQQLAGWAIMRPGAIPARDRAAPYEAMIAGDSAPG